jgi:hypothetical protein
MNIQQMINLFQANKVPETYYVIEGLGIGECLGIERMEDQWHVYYSERGSKSTQGLFPDEDSACRFMIKLINRRMIDEQGRPLKTD